MDVIQLKEVGWRQILAQQARTMTAGAGLAPARGATLGHLAV